MSTVPKDSACASPAVLGQDLIVPTSCPQCHEKGFVPWNHLDRGLRCPKCKSWFQIERDGQTLLRRTERPFACPRCHQRGWTPLVGEQAECPICKLPLF